jgi:Protein of unknown function (DUF3800)
MGIQAYLDDSYSAGGVHVLAGYVAPAESWTAFSKEWEQLLPRALPGKTGKHRFKMKEMAHRMDDVPAFFNVISNHALYCFSVMTRSEDYDHAKDRIWSNNAELIWTPHEDIKNLMLRVLIWSLYDNVFGDDRNATWIKPGETLDLYIDNDATPEWVLDDEEWEHILRSVPEHVREYIGQKPQYVDDEDCLPLQAADFLAWWVRKGYEDGNIPDIARGNFGTWKGKHIPGFGLAATEDQITETLMGYFRKGVRIPGQVNVFDSKTKPKDESVFDVQRFDKRNKLFSYFQQKLKLLGKPHS